ALFAVRAPATGSPPTPEPAADLAAEAISDPDIDTETLEAQASAQRALDAVIEAEAPPEPQLVLATPDEVAVAEPVVAEPEILETAPTAEAPRPPRKPSAKARPKSPKAR